MLDATYDYQTRVYCIISDQRVFRSRSPQMFSRVIERTGLQGTYVPFMVTADDLGKALESLRVLNISGANITAPFKEQVLPHLDVLSEGANIIGAVNTIVCNQGELKGYNTNAIGFMDALGQANFDVAGKRALVLGTGGSARAVVFIFNWLRAASVVVAGRNAQKAERLAAAFDCTACSITSLADEALDVDIVVNATCVSSSSECATLADIAAGMTLPACSLVLDLNYGRKENIWQALGRQNGVAFMDGLPALAYQARRTFLLWTGQELPQEEFISALTA